MSVPVVDLHCDLLAYLNGNRGKHSPEDEASRCSLPLLKKGRVSFQVLAIFSETGKEPRKEFEGQLECYHNIKTMSGTQFAPAVENASGLLEEGESMSLLPDRFDQEDWLYVSMTWKSENRFGGGDSSQAGLKADGEKLLDYMDGKGVAIDLSHASDALAEGILDYIHKKGLKLLPIASHSNFRKVKEHPRNLPDSFAKEIIRMGGVIGINFVRHFVGNEPEDFVHHIEYGLSLGGEDALALGADFFGGISIPAIEHLKPFYQKRYSNSGCYPEFYQLLEPVIGQERVNKIFYKNSHVLRTYPNKLLNEG